MEFKERKTAPEADNKFYNSNENLYFANGIGMPNCTAYAWGRLFEITGKKPAMGVANACDWYKEAKQLGYSVGSTPKLGSVICWDGAGTNPYGHVGIVEEILSDGSLKISESAWGGIYWNNGLIVSPTNNYQHSTSPNAYPCLGFIYYENSSDEELLVRRMYVEVLDRAVDESGFKHYTDINISENDLRRELTNSDENTKDLNHNHKFWFIVKCYKVILGRYPENDEVVNARLKCSNQDIFNSIWNSPENKNKITKPEKTLPKKGNAYTLDNCSVYASENGQTIGKRSGKYYVWSNEIRNERIRMTNALERCGVGGQVSFWVEVNNLK